MKSIQRIGGVSAVVAALTFVIGLVMFATLFIDYTTAADPSEAVAFLVDNQFGLYLWNLAITIIFGIALVPLVLALHRRLRDESPVLTPIATVFGVHLGWTDYRNGDDQRHWIRDGRRSARDRSCNGRECLGCPRLGGQWPRWRQRGGRWHVGAAIERCCPTDRTFSKWLGYLGIVIGVAGLITVVPPLEDVGVIFGLGLIVWFLAVGNDLLRRPTIEPVGAVSASA